MAAFLKALSIIGSVLPAVLSFIQSLETSGAPGKDKKAAALAFLQSLLTGASGWVKELTSDTIAIVIQVADHVIDAAVAAYNAVGIFTHKHDPPAAKGGKK